MAVVSSGCKSFLDIPRTLEYLETEGVCVGTFADGRQGPVDFPAFFTRDSGIKSPKVIQNEAEAAAIVCTLLWLYIGALKYLMFLTAYRCTKQTRRVIGCPFRQPGAA